jgi:hypothetical protein
MADCECLPGCLFFNDKMADSTGLGKIYKKNTVKAITRNAPDTWYSRSSENRWYPRPVSEHDRTGPGPPGGQ